jgi:Domain of unknown function (DUF4375)
MTETIHSYWDYIEPYWDVFDIYNGHHGFESSIHNAPRPIVLLYAAHFCQSEVHNGGFLQFFWNNTGVLAPEAIEGYSVIGMPTLASLLQEAASTLGTPYPRERNDRKDALLIASGHSKRELKQIFKKHENLYRAFAEATKALPFDLLSKQFWQAAKTENGGFEAAATLYSQKPFLIH